MKFHLLRWKDNVSLRLIFVSCLEVFGTLWLATEIVSFFSDQGGAWLKARGMSFGGLGVVCGFFLAGWRSFPVSSIRSRIDGKDVSIAIIVGDILDNADDLVIPSNTTFDTDLNRSIISNRSIQGQFTVKHFGESTTALDAILESELRNLDYTNRPSKIGKVKQFSPGSVCKVEAANRVAYFVAICHMNDSGNAEGTLDMLLDSLPKLWEFIARKGRKGVLCVPLLGTGLSRTPINREESFREIVRSFVAACGEKSFCDELRIYIHPVDFVSHGLNFEMLANFLRYQCAFASAGGRGTNRGLSDFQKVSVSSEGGITPGAPID